METTKFNLEYSMRKTPIGTLWNMIHLTNGLAEWFADHVSDDGDIYTFSWSGHSQQARLLDMEENTYIRFHWLDEAPGTYFELRILITEITGEVTLLVTDHALPSEVRDLEITWNGQVEALKRRLGV